MKRVLLVMLAMTAIPIVFAYPYPWGTNRYDLLANTITFADGSVQTSASGGGGGSGGTPPQIGSVNAADTSGTLTLSGPQTVDGQALVANNTVILTAQSTASQNGPVLINAGAWSRPTWWASGTVIPAQSSVVVCAALGNTNNGNQGSCWTLDTSAAVTVGTTAEAWSQVTCNTNGATCALADNQFHPNGSHLANPVVTGSGCSAVAGSGDNSGAITATGADTCTLTFANLMTYQGTNLAPFCAVAPYSSTVLPRVSTPATASAVIFTTGAAGTFSYVCLN